MRKSIISAVLLFVAMVLIASCSKSSEPRESDVISLSEISVDIKSPTFSVPAGFYNESFDLEILGDENLTIRYTLDGTEPTESSPVYQQPITISDRSSDENDISTVTGISTTEDFVPRNKVSKGTVVRAALFSDDGRRSKTVTATYFVGLDYGNALVISIVTDRDGLFSYDNGIFMLGKQFDEWKEEVGSSFSGYGDWEYEGNFSLKGDEWEREINIEFFEDGTLCYSQTAGMRVAGAATRTYRQKSLRITARSQYGEKNFKFPLIPNNQKDGNPENNVTKYRSFVLRNGGNDADIARIRDPFIQTAAANCLFSTQQTRLAIAFINGEYWGVYTLTEDYNERYIEENYGVDKDNVAIIKNGKLEEGSESDLELFEATQSFITSNDMSLDENYSAACNMIDVKGFAQYCALHLYIGSQDGPFQYNNWRAWRAVTTSEAPYEDGKIRMMLYDTEYSLGIYDGGENYNDNTFDTLSENASFCGSIFNSLMNNDEFRSLFIAEFLNMRNTVFSPENAETIIDMLYNEYKNYMPEHYARFGPSWITPFNDIEYFKSETERMKNYLNGRYETAPALLCQYLGIDAEASIIEDENGFISLQY